MSSQTQAKQSEEAQALAWQRPPDYEPNVRDVHVRSVKTPQGVRLLSTQELAFVDAYLEGAHGIPSEAARYAKYSNPSQLGKTLERRLASVISEERQTREAKAIATPNEVMRTWTRWMRRASEYPDTVATKATEYLGKSLGVLSDTLDVRLDRASLQRELQLPLADTPKLIAAIDAEIAEPAPVADETQVA